MIARTFIHPVAAEARALLQYECAAAPNRFGSAFFDEHLVPVVDYSLTLAHRLGADPFVVETAAWLHDRAAVRDFGTLPSHAQDSAELARAWLSERGIPKEQRERIALCIETHSAPTRSDSTSLEQRCLSNADVLSHIARPTYWYWYLYQVRNMDLAGARAWYQSRLSHWEALEPVARELVRADCAALRHFLDCRETRRIPSS